MGGWSERGERAASRFTAASTGLPGYVEIQVCHDDVDVDVDDIDDDNHHCNRNDLFRSQ